MAIQELELPLESHLPRFAIWQIYEDGELFHHLIMDGRDTGRLDWEESMDGRVGYIDGLDAEEELEVLGIRHLSWLAIAQCLKEQHPKVETIWHLDGIVEVIEVEPSDIGFAT